MIKTLADQYLAQNAGRRYPFKDDTALPAWLPDSGVLDFRCTVHGVPAETAVEARLVKAGHTADKQAQFTVALTAGGVLLDELVFEVPENAADGAPYTAYASGSRSHGALTVTSAAVPPGSVAGLPYDTEIEYLESTGKQWIDTAVQSSDKVQFSVWANKVAGDMKLFGNSYYLGPWADIAWYQSVYRGTEIPQVAQAWDTVTIEKAPRLLTVAREDDLFTASSWWTAASASSGITTYGTAVPLFAHINPYGTKYGDNVVAGWGTPSFRLRISFFKAWSNGELVRDLTPVRLTNELGQTEGAMYDRVSGALHRNQGDDAFLRGDDLPPVYTLDIPFAATTIVCDSLKVHSIQSAHDLADARDDDDPAGLDATAAIDGEIALAEGRNAEPYLDGNRLRLDVFKGAGLGERCQSAVSGGQRCGTVLFTINGERPGSDGDIRIVGDGGITVVPDPENHAVEIRMDDEASNRIADGCTPVCPTYTTVETNATEEAE